MSEISRHPVVAATRALRFADHVTKRNEGSGNENVTNRRPGSKAHVSDLRMRKEGQLSTWEAFTEVVVVESQHGFHDFLGDEITYKRTHVRRRPTLKDVLRFRNGLLRKPNERSIYERTFMSEPIGNLSRIMVNK